MCTVTDAKPSQIVLLIPKVMADVGAIEKHRKNQQQGYNFRGIDDLYNAMQEPLIKHGIFYVPELLKVERDERTTKAGGALIYTRVEVAYTFFAPDGSSIRLVVPGEAMDSGDKSTNKAMSAALKYALMQMFCIPTEADDDADNTTHTPTPKSATPPRTAAPSSHNGSGTGNGVGREAAATAPSNNGNGHAPKTPPPAAPDPSAILGEIGEREAEFLKFYDESIKEQGHSVEAGRAVLAGMLKQRNMGGLKAMDDQQLKRIIESASNGDMNKHFVRK